jgi:hypothetical protein
MTQISWPMAVVLVAVIAVSGALAAAHVISADWIERTLTGIIGFVIGHSLGALRERRRPPTIAVVHPPPPSE